MGQALLSHLADVYTKAQGNKNDVLKLIIHSVYCRVKKGFVDVGKVM